MTLLLETSSDVSSIPHQLFAKINSGVGARVLESEFESLQIINSTYPNLYPQAILYERHNDLGLLLMTFHQLTSISSMHAADAGRALATQHKISNERFGWSNDNYIGLTHQSNQWNEDWPTFFREQRLQRMKRRAADQGLPAAMLEDVNQVIGELDELLSHDFVPSLVHGDLWSGNLGYDETTQQALFYDPAPYYGDREVDLAMTELFGRQPESFYQAYQQVWPLSPNYEQRRPVYNLYHALNHVVLFGSTYHTLVEDCLNQIDF